MTLSHIVAFKFKDAISEEEKKQVHKDFLQLKENCKKENGETYIINLIGGTKNISTEGAGKDLDHAFIVTFNNSADRDYYVEKDPAHDKFATNVRKIISDAFIYDFEH